MVTVTAVFWSLVRGVEPERGARSGPLVQRAGELAGAAAKIYDAPSGARLDKVEQIEERSRSLAFELLVLGRIPAVGRQGRAVWLISRAQGSRG